MQRMPILAGILLALTAATTSADDKLPAFAGAEGWGADTPHGRGGKVLIVDNLNDDGPGSLRAALQASGPRIIVFRVSGAIKLDKKDTVNRYIDMTPKHSNFMVAGQTSPGGITVTGDRKAATGSYKKGPEDFVFRFVRFRIVAGGKWSGIDCIEYNNANRFVLDHCDFSGGTDGCLDITSCTNYTVSWSTIANSAYCCNDHGGSLLSYAPTSYVSLHHNVWAHHESRCGGWFHWSGKAATDKGMIDYRNNICYDGVNYMFVIRSEPPVHVNALGNWFIAGPNTPQAKGRTKKIWGMVDLKPATVHAGDNVMVDHEGTKYVGRVREHNIGTYAEKPFDMPKVTTFKSDEAYEKVLTWVGAFPRDPMNDRTVNEIRTRTGKLKNDKADFIEKGPEAPADTDRDGMPDFWEKAMKLDPADPTDNVKDQDGDGYTNIEEYLNDLALARLKQDYHNPVYPIPENWPDYDPSACKQIKPAAAK